MSGESDFTLVKVIGLGVVVVIFVVVVLLMPKIFRANPPADTAAPPNEPGPSERSGEPRER